MNILSAIKIYDPGWELKSIEDVDQATLDAVKSAKVIVSQYGLSVRLDLHTGQCGFIPLDRSSRLAEGSPVDLRQMVVVTLKRSGCEDIYRLLERHLANQ